MKILMTACFQDGKSDLQESLSSPTERWPTQTGPTWQERQTGFNHLMASWTQGGCFQPWDLHTSLSSVSLTSSYTNKTVFFIIISPVPSFAPKIQHAFKIYLLSEWLRMMVFSMESTVRLDELLRIPTGLINQKERHLSISHFYKQTVSATS